MNVALGPQSGFCDVLSHEEGWASRIRLAQSGTQVVTVADIERQHPGSELFIIKIDIEGFESELFAENTEWIDRAFLIYIEPHDWMIPDRVTTENFRSVFIGDKFHMVISGENVAYVRREHGYC
jgi:hypothetical protein